MSITNATIWLNSISEGDGGGIYNSTSDEIEHPSIVTIKNSIIWGNTFYQIYQDGFIVSDSIVCASCNNPFLISLANNGGFTETVALGENSSAIDAGNNATCASTDQRGVTRPQGGHCDIGAYEKLDDAGFPTFVDVPTDAFGWSHIESIYEAGITGGCTTSPLNYCPDNTVTRAQMAIFLMRGINGSSYSPPPPTGTVFSDVPTNAFGADFIEAFAAQGITGGCGGGNYCPDNTVTRGQMAVFLLRAKYGSGYNPPTATGTMFTDIPISHPFVAWIEQLANESITGGCGGGNYCPDNSVTRAQMAIFIQRTFNLRLP